MADIEHGRCHAERAPLDSPPLIQNGKIILQTHHIGWMVSSALTLVAIGVSFWLVNKHVGSYTNKYEQRYIVRILFMVPIYAVVSLASYIWWNHSTPLLLLRDCYESTVLTSFFYLLLLYMSPDPNEQKEIFRKNGLSKENDRERRRRGEPIQKWMLPISFLRSKPKDGLYFLQLMKWGVLQYCVVRPGTTLAAVILDYVGLYCEESWSLGWGHIWIVLVVSISVTIAMYCLIQIYMVTKVELAPQKPLLKLFAIKAVVFLTFWQATFLSVLTLFGIVKDTPYMTANNINIGIGALAECVEMALFAILHLKAFSYKPYVTGGDPTPRWRSLGHAMNFKETGREIWAGALYMLHKTRGREVDTQARREAALEAVFGRSRFAITREANALDSAQAKGSEKEVSVTVEVEKEVHVGKERQWLGVGDDYGYGLGYQARRQREGSEGLGSQIEKELARRGYALRGASSGAYSPIADAEAAHPAGHHSTQASWWRRMYNRLSQSGPDPEVEEISPPASHSDARHWPSRWRSSHRPGAAPLMADVQEDDYNDPPPPSAIRTYRESKNQSKRHNVKRKPPPALDPPLLFTSFADIPSPLSSPDGRNGPHSSSPQTRQVVIPTFVAHERTPAPSPMPAPSMQSVQADSFLDRAFAGSVEPGSSAEVLSAGPSSSQSHYNRVKLASVPAVVTEMKELPKIPVVVDGSGAGPLRCVTVSAVSGPSTSPPSVSVVPESVQPLTVPLSPPRTISSERVVSLARTADRSMGQRRSSHRRDSALFYPEPRDFSPPQPPPHMLPPLYQSPPQSPTSPRLRRASAAYSRGERRISGTLQGNASYVPANRYVPTRDRIVLPAPLAHTSTATATGNIGSPTQLSPQHLMPSRDLSALPTHSSRVTGLPR